jgi:hypothetical protein
MKDIVLAILAICLLFLGLPVLLLWVRDRVRDARRRRTPEQIQADALAYRQRLLSPDRLAVETQMRGFVPERLAALYDDQATVLSTSFEIRPPQLGPKEFGEFIEDFLPLDLESQKFTCDLVEAGWGKGFCFAGDGCGNFYWMPVSDTPQSDAPVFFACHDPWGNEKIADSLDEFLFWPRKTRRKF